LGLGPGANNFPPYKNQLATNYYTKISFALGSLFGMIQAMKIEH